MLNHILVHASWETGAIDIDPQLNPRILEMY